jgi:hypothetical protein
MLTTVTASVIGAAPTDLSSHPGTPYSPSPLSTLLSSPFVLAYAFRLRTRLA